LETINDIFFAIADRDDRVVMMHRQAIQWVSISAGEFYRDVVGVARALQQWGIRKGDRVAILSENRPEWAIADFACLSIGAVVVPVYTTLTDEQAAYILRDSGARAIFLSTEKQLQKIGSVRAQTSLDKIVVMDAVETAHAFHMQRLMLDGPQQRDTNFDTPARQINPDDLATIVYTSGTTGVPKGAMLTHRNIAANISAWLPALGVHSGHISLSFLPLSHVTARNVDLGLLYRGVTLAYVSFFEQLPKALLEVRPTIFVAVPRVYEKIHGQVDLKAKGFPANQIYRWSRSVGRKRRAEIAAGETPKSFGWRLANHLVYSKVRAGMGARRFSFPAVLRWGAS